MVNDNVTRLGNKSIVIRFWVRNYRFLSRVVWRLIYLLFNCSIPPTAILEDGVNIAHGIGIVIHQNSVVLGGTKIYQNVTIGSGNGPKIGKNCILGSGCCILGNITIGNNVKIGANAVVLKDVPDDCTVVGIPGKILRK